MTIWEKIKPKLVFFLCIFEAKAREYFQGACHHFLVPATEVPETVQLVFSMELLAISSMSEVRSEYKITILDNMFKRSTQSIVCAFYFQKIKINI